MDTGAHYAPPSVETLGSRIAHRGPLGEMDAVGWIVRLAKRLESLHAHGVAHGSVSGECVRIGGDSPTLRGQLVDVRRVASRPAHQSPERLAGEGVSVADDTWALGVTLYLALTARLPFGGANEQDLRRAILSHAAPRLAAFGIGDGELQGVVDRVLTVDPWRRTRTIDRLRRELEAWLARRGIGDLPPVEEDDDESLSPTPAMVGRPQAPTLQLDPSQGVVSAADVSRLPPPPPLPSAPPRPPPLPPIPMKSLRPGGTLIMDPPPAHAWPGSAGGPSPAFAHAPAPFAPSPPPLASPPPPPSPFAPPLAPPANVAPPDLAPPNALAATKRSAFPAPAARSGRSPLAIAGTVVLSIGALAAGGLLAVWWWHSGKMHAHANHPAPPAATASAAPTSHAPEATATASSTASAAPAAPATASAEPSAPPDEPPPAASATATAPATSTATAASSADPAPRAAGDVNACIFPLFAEGTFEPGQPVQVRGGPHVEAPDFAFVCSTDDPRKGGETIRSVLVRAGAGKPASAGMREWAVLGWYELAAFAILRSHCCPGAAPLTLPAAPDTCSPIDGALNDLAAAANSGDAGRADEALDRYTAAVHCTLRAGAGDRFGRRATLHGGEDTAFRKTLSRVVTSSKR